MNEWLSSLLNSEQSEITIILVAFLLGFTSVISCACSYTTIGLIAGYMSSISPKAKTKVIVVTGVFFLLGTMFSMALIGALIGYSSHLFLHVLGDYWKIAAGFLSIFFGLYVLGWLPFKIHAPIAKFDNAKGTILSAVIFGIIVGGLSSLLHSCCNPLFPIVMTATFVKGSIWWGMLILASYSLGHSLPIAASMVGFGLGLEKLTKAFAKIQTIVIYAGGAMLIIIGFYFLLDF